MFDHISESHDPCCPQCNFVASSEISISEHMANFRHRWDDIKATQCSSWGCVKDFASLQEYWRHRKQFHPGAIYS